MGTAREKVSPYAEKAVERGAHYAGVAVEKAGLYTKQGIPQVSSRIGVMEAVG